MLMGAHVCRTGPRRLSRMMVLRSALALDANSESSGLQNHHYNGNR
jgi:hypothetical protein